MLKLKNKFILWTVILALLWPAIVFAPDTKTITQHDELTQPRAADSLFIHDDSTGADKYIQFSHFVSEINVKDYGAAGDGVTDDTTAVTNAINAGSDILFPGGSYKITSTLPSIAGKTLRGIGYWGAQGLTLESEILFNPTVAADTLFESGTGDRACIRDLYLEGPNNAGGGDIAIDLQTGAIDWLIENCYFRYFDIAIQDTGYQNRIQYCRILDYGTYGIKYLGGATAYLDQSFFSVTTPATGQHHIYADTAFTTQHFSNTVFGKGWNGVYLKNPTVSRFTLCHFENADFGGGYELKVEDTSDWKGRIVVLESCRMDGNIDVTTNTGVGKTTLKIDDCYFADPTLHCRSGSVFEVGNVRNNQTAENVDLADFTTATGHITFTNRIHRQLYITVTGSSADEDIDFSIGACESDDTYGFNHRLSGSITDLAKSGNDTIASTDGTVTVSLNSTGKVINIDLPFETFAVGGATVLFNSTGTAYLIQARFDTATNGQIELSMTETASATTLDFTDLVDDTYISFLVDAITSENVAP